MKISYLLDELDKLLALIGAIFSLILTIWIKLVIVRPIYVTIGIFCFMVCTGYLIISRSFDSSFISSLEELRISNHSYITLNILFFTLLSYSIITIYLRPDPYIRPLWYFISTALMTAIVATEILFLSPQKSQIYFTLCKIILVGISLQYSQILIFPNVVGIDPWWHRWFTLRILDNGYIPEGLAYSKLPLMHLMIGITSLLTDLNYKLTTMVSISFFQVVCDALFIFLLGKFLISTKVGLLAALILEVANNHISFGYWVIPNTMAAILILPIIFILLKLKIDKPFIGTSIIIFLMGTLILTHTVTSICMAILLFVFWLSFECYKRLFPQEKLLSLSWTICILFSTVMFAYWSYISGHIITLANLIKLGFYNPLFEGKYPYLSNIPFWEQLFYYLGMYLFFGISFIGCFYMISKQFRNSNRFVTTIGGIVILFLAFFPSLTGYLIIQHRWNYFSQILLAIPLSLSLFLLGTISKHRLIKGSLISLSVFVLSFLLIMSPISNIDNRLFFPNIGVRYAFIESELAGMDKISIIWNGTIGTDWYSTYSFKFQFDTNFISIDNSLETRDFSMLQDMLIIIREEILNHPLHSPDRGILKLNYNPYLTLEEQKFSRIYNCGSASGYLKP